MIQLGRWRRAGHDPKRRPASTTRSTADQTRLPRNKAEGDIPLMAFATGDVDALECVLRKIGIDDSEFTDPTGTGRVHVYNGNRSTQRQQHVWTKLTASAPTMPAPVGMPPTLANYDLAAVEVRHGAFRPTRRPGQLRQRDAGGRPGEPRQLANAGGRIFATHYSYIWLYRQPRPSSTTANWNNVDADPLDEPT